jgi:hypothetical protein
MSGNTMPAASAAPTTVWAMVCSVSSTRDHGIAPMDGPGQVELRPEVEHERGGGAGSNRGVEADLAPPLGDGEGEREAGEHREHEGEEDCGGAEDDSEGEATTDAAAAMITAGRCSRAGYTTIDAAVPVDVMHDVGDRDASGDRGRDDPAADGSACHATAREIPSLNARPGTRWMRRQ